MTEKTITTCDIVANEDEYQLMLTDQNHGATHYEKMLCGQPALRGERDIPITLWYGKNQYHICPQHAQLPLIEILRALKLL